MNEPNRRDVAGWVTAVDRSETRNADGSDRVLRLAGYAVVFDTPSEPMGRLVETIAPTAFDEVLATTPDVKFQAEHQGLALARTGNGTMRITKDNVGLAFEVDLNPNVSAARDLYYLVERGDITQMSFGFVIGEEEVTETADGLVARILKVARLFELSAVTWPAYEATSVMTVPMPMLDDDVEPPADDMWVRDLAAARRAREASLD